MVSRYYLYPVSLGGSGGWFGCYGYAQVVACPETVAVFGVNAYVNVFDRKTGKRRFVFLSIFQNVKEPFVEKQGPPCH